MKHISSERKTNIINRYYNGDPVAELTEATGIARSTKPQVLHGVRFTDG